MTPEVEDVTRRSLVEKAIEHWAKDLIDTGRRNPLLYYRDLTAGTLDLAEADRSGLTGFLAGKATKLTTLFPDAEALPDALKRARTIRRKIVAWAEERGIQTGYLAIGLATWPEPAGQDSGRPMAAPILLREIAIKSRGAAEEDFDLELADEAEFNPVLLHHLTSSMGVGDRLSGLPEDPDEKSWEGIAEAFRALESACSEVPGFTTSLRLIVGSFSYQKLPMVKDLQTNPELLAESDIIAALAGDLDARQALRASAGVGDRIELSEPDFTPPQDEFLVLDADSSQNYAINAALAGHHLVIKGPPGTGKSQTIANLIAGLIARKKRVLFVAEKRAAIDAVVGRLESAQLDTWVMDLHDGLSDRRRVAHQLAETLDRASRTPQPDLAAVHRDLSSNRDRLLGHRAMMHSPRDPWGFSVYELQSMRLANQGLNPSFRLRGEALKRATPENVERAIAAITEYADLGGLMAAEAGSWSGAPVDTPDQARQAIELVMQLRNQTVPETTTALKALIGEVGLKTPDSVSGWQQSLDLIDRVVDLQRWLQPAAFQTDLRPLISATATRRWRKQNAAAMPWVARRRALKAARMLCASGKPTKAQLHEQLSTASDLNAEWQAASMNGGPPNDGGDLTAARLHLEQLSTQLRGLGAFLVSADFDALDPASSLPDRLDDLIGDQPLLARLPRIRELKQQIISTGFDGFVTECRANAATAGNVRGLLEAAWIDSILEELAITDSNYGAFNGATVSRAADNYRVADTRHIESTGARVQRAAAEALYAARDAHPDQAMIVTKQANLKRRHMPMRKLIDEAGDVLLAAKPCWAMSPLVVSQVLPMKRMFDVVIFDEASQIPPADAIASIARGSGLVVAGDERQLPPTTFFGTTDSDEDDEEDTDQMALTSGFESILNNLAPLIPVRSLQWHYRSRDERLIAFSNAHIYDSSLTTFPGSHQDGVMRHVLVPWSPGINDIGGSSSAEVQRVVDLIIDHAETRQEESLGVIAMGIKHADRIDAALRERLKGRSDLDDFFNESNHERFFVKNLERVQGDERDAIIMSIGYGKSSDGRMLYNFGPINQQGGERRLNVAVSRAKCRMTVVSSFGSADLDSNKLNARGAELLGAYVRFAESAGSDLGSFSTVPPQLNFFEQSVRDRLQDAGLNLKPQFGVSGYRIDFVAAHPSKPGKYVLAIEADGASYHSSHTARDRDRLRQEHLERLGWRFHRIWSTDWFRNAESEVAKVMASFASAVHFVDNGGSGRHAAAVPDEEPVLTPTADPQRTMRKPYIRYGEQIAHYRPGHLTDVIRWIESDGLLRTEEELIRAAMAELGWGRLGPLIDAGLREAITRARRT